MSETARRLNMHRRTLQRIWPSEAQNNLFLIQQILECVDEFIANLFWGTQFDFEGVHIIFVYDTK